MRTLPRDVLIDRSAGNMAGITGTELPEGSLQGEQSDTGFRSDVEERILQPRQSGGLGTIGLTNNNKIRMGCRGCTHALPIGRAAR